MPTGTLVLPDPAASLQHQRSAPRSEAASGTGVMKLDRAILDQPFDLALVVALARTAEAVAEQVVAHQLGEGARALALARRRRSWPPRSSCCRTGSTAARRRRRRRPTTCPSRNASVVSARIGLHEAGVGVRQVHAEEVDLLPHAADHGHRLAEVDLGMAGRMGQRHEGLPPLRPADPHVVLHHRVAAGIAVLVAQTLEDPLGRVPLLDRRGPVRLQDRRRSPAAAAPASASRPASSAYSPAAARTGTSWRSSLGSARTPEPPHAEMLPSMNTNCRTAA